MPKININGQLLYFAEKGDRDSRLTILLIHGAAGNSLQWENQLEQLSRRHRIIALDLPGHGSSHGEGYTDIEDYLKVVKDFVDILRLDSLIICGHSMGGAIALAYAFKYPKELKALILISTGARLKVAPYFMEVCREGNQDKMAAIMLKYAFSPFVPLVKIQELQKKWGYPPAAVVYNDFCACDKFDMMDSIEAINIPTLIICGDEDYMTPMKYSHYLNEKIKGSELAIINAAGHVLFGEKPQELSDIMVDFTERQLQKLIKA